MRMSIGSDLIRRAMDLYIERGGGAAPRADFAASSAETVDGRRYVILRRSLESSDVLAVYRLTSAGRLEAMANGERIVQRAGRVGTASFGLPSRPSLSPATRPCPKCHRLAAKHLDMSSTGADVDYYRCGQCGHVWHVPKNAPNAPPTAVTQDETHLALPGRRRDLPLRVDGFVAHRMTERPPRSLAAERRYLLRQTIELQRWVLGVADRPFTRRAHARQQQRMRELRVEIQRFRARFAQTSDPFRRPSPR